METYADEKLVADYLKGDEKSLEILIKRYLKPIYSFVYRYVGNSQDVEDVTQEVFLKVWSNLRKFNPKKSPAPYRPARSGTGSGFKTWIFTIAKNTSIDALKKKKPVFSSELIENAPDSRPLPTLNSLDKILEKLPPQYRMVLFLRYNDHFTFREIAESLGESIDTIKTRHRRGIITLKKLLKEDWTKMALFVVLV